MDGERNYDLRSPQGNMDSAFRWCQVNRPGHPAIAQRAQEAATRAMWVAEHPGEDYATAYVLTKRYYAELAAAALSVIVPALTQQIRALADEWDGDAQLLLAEGQTSYANCTWIDRRALLELADELDAAVRAEE